MLFNKILIRSMTQTVAFILHSKCLKCLNTRPITLKTGLLKVRILDVSGIWCPEFGSALYTGIPGIQMVTIKIYENLQT